MRQTANNYAAMNAGEYDPYSEFFEDQYGNIVNGLGEIVQYAKDRKRPVHTNRPAAMSYPTNQSGKYTMPTIKKSKAPIYGGNTYPTSSGYPVEDDYPKAIKPSVKRQPVATSSTTAESAFTTGNSKVDKAVNEKRFIIYKGTDSKLTSSITISDIKLISEKDIRLLPNSSVGIVKGYPITKIPASVKAIIDDSNLGLIVRDESYNVIDNILTTVFNSVGDIITVKSFLNDFDKLNALLNNEQYSELLQIKAFKIFKDILINETELHNLYAVVRLPKEVDNEILLSNIGVRPAYIMSSKLKTFISNLGLKSIILVGGIFMAEVFFNTIRILNVNPLSLDDKEAIKNILGE